MPDNVSMKKAVAWTALAKYSTAVLGVLFSAILSRLLTPNEYGTVAVINIFVVLFTLFCDMGFGAAVIQDKGMTEKQTNDIFSWTVYLGFILQFLFILASFLISWIYEDSIYIPLGAILSCSLFFGATNMIPNAMMLKQKRFKTIAYRTILCQITTALFTIFLATRGLGVYALVLQNLLSNLLIFIWNELTVRLKFLCQPEFSSIRRIWGYSVYQFLTHLLNFFNRNLDSLLIGKFFSKADLGQYNKSYTLMQMPISYIPGVLGPALHPILSEHQNDPKYIYDRYLGILKILSIVGCFLTCLLYFNSEEIVILLFGDQWYAAILPFKILALSVWPQLLINTIGPIYQSIGNTKLMFKSGIIIGPMIIAFIIIGCIFGSINTVAICVTIAYFLNFLVAFIIMVRYGFNESVSSFFLSFYHELIFFSVMISVTFLPFNIGNLLLSFVVKIAFLTAVFFILLLSTKQYKIFLPLFHLNK